MRFLRVTKSQISEVKSGGRLTSLLKITLVFLYNIQCTWAQSSIIYAPYRGPYRMWSIPWTIPWTIRYVKTPPVTVLLSILLPRFQNRLFLSNIKDPSGNYDNNWILIKKVPLFLQAIKNSLIWKESSLYFHNLNLKVENVPSSCYFSCHLAKVVRQSSNL